MTDRDICESSPSLVRSIREAGRSIEQEASPDWVWTFRPAIRPLLPGDARDRSPAWFVVRYAWPSESSFFRIMRMIKLNYRTFTYTQAKLGKRKGSVTRSWFPGYVFVEFDVELDFWQQLYQMPGFLSILGSPSALPVGEMDRIEKVLVEWLPKADPGFKFSPGESVRVINGPFTSFPGIVKSLSPNGKEAIVVVMIFGRPTDAELSIKDIEKI